MTVDNAYMARVTWLKCEGCPRKLLRLDEEIHHNPPAAGWAESLQDSCVWQAVSGWCPRCGKTALRALARSPNRGLYARYHAEALRIRRNWLRRGRALLRQMSAAERAQYRKLEGRRDGDLTVALRFTTFPRSLWR